MSAVKQLLSNLNIRTKLIILFVFIKVIPLILLAVITLIGIHSLYDFFINNTAQVKQTTKEIVSSTANTAVADSILALDRKSQESLEKMSGQIAQSVADFLYERDDDIRFLATLPKNRETYENFMHEKLGRIIRSQSDKYRYDDTASKWVRVDKLSTETTFKRADLSDNAREFNRIDPVKYATQSLPLYKEITFFDLNGKEQIKVSSLNPEKEDISKPQNTYIKAETYFADVQKLKKGQIYVSDVIGAYVPSKIIGTFTKEKAKKAGIPFEPEKYGYAGRENPVGKRFEGIVRFVTPVYERGQKVGYISLALDHRHIMAFTDTVDPLSYSPMDVSDASDGNYAFMWDYKGRSISHPRDYFIAGFDPATGKRVKPWLSSEVARAFDASKSSDINAFLKGYPKFDAQSLSKTPSLEGLQQGLIGLDCRYLNFAPQCQGWMQLTENGGQGSFIILWSNVWKLTTAATIPYYTGHYGNTPRGFGFVTLGANVDEFHKAADRTKENLNSILVEQLSHIDAIVGKAEKRTKDETDLLINQLTISTLVMIVFMIVIAIWLSNLLRRRLQELILGAKQYSQNNLSYRIPVDSHDEIGMLSDSFNDMAGSLQKYIRKERDLNHSLEARIEERTEQLTVLNRRIQQELTEKEKQEQQLKIYARVFSNTTEAIVITDVQGNIEHVNEAFTLMTGYLPEDVMGKSYSLLRSNHHSLLFYRKIWQTVFSKESWEGEVWTSKKDGTLYPVLAIIVPILDKNGNITNFAGIQHDMSEIKQNEQELHRQAYYDSLTNLANRALAYDRLEHALVNAKSNQTKVAILFLDLDKFKQVNDVLGHDAGDSLLCEVGKRLCKVCKETDTISRLGGDEFLIILEGVSFYEDAIHVVENIIKELEKPFMVNDQVIHSSTSVGITFYPDDGLTVRRLLKNSDIAMYRAKAKGRGVYEIFTEELGQQVQESVLLEQALKEAVINKDFLMHYQPIVNVKEQRVIGVEALMRWEKDEKLYSPERFIEMLEHTKLIVEATEGMMITVFALAKMLNNRYEQDIYVAVNISAMHFALDDFCDRIIKLVELSGINASQICLEVTETIFLHDIEAVSKKLSKLKELGFHVALDDFGTGYSSLSYLKRLPLDKIKIDRTFINGLPDSTGDVAITTSVCSWADNFCMDVIAEGVETEEQLAFLEQLGCNNVQGYLFAKPMAEHELLDYLDENGWSDTGNEW
ncbi:putative bifunctional diguanylate cyclase/phosphodiesterase [Vibrio salinus]|uniref:putative bifunctional diguanylate cyclase/phosphodiesterase n=1 Tax=Vibrio salinus TaxID=2899784 RepID=UPI001E645716|nr:EAL domain-containing protein [Vibrio salinus]MCE0494791.1 EAL domain-containing protein [Vibrio salinus]